MNPTHFRALEPVCPACRKKRGTSEPLVVGFVASEDEGRIVEGALHCVHAACRLEFPIIDGIPILVPDPRAYVAQHVVSILAREDLSPEIQQLIGECCGEGSAFDHTRRYVGCYAWDHYSEFDSSSDDGGCPPGSIGRVLDEAMSLLAETPGGRQLETGCGPGRAMFDLAARGADLVLGIDNDFAMIRFAMSVLRNGRARYEVRREGLIHERREHPVPVKNAEAIDFWVADATAIPLPAESFDLAVSLNVLDSVNSPIDHLRELRHVLRTGGNALVATPFDWSSQFITPDAWIGGHSPRAIGHGCSRSVLEALLTPGQHPMAIQGFEIAKSRDRVPWHMRVHARSAMTYSLEVLALAARG